MLNQTYILVKIVFQGWLKENFPNGIPAEGLSKFLYERGKHERAEKLEREHLIQSFLKYVSRILKHGVQRISFLFLLLLVGSVANYGPYSLSPPGKKILKVFLQADFSNSFSVTA